jgi:hypothetical protein
MEGSGSDLIEELSSHFSGLTEEANIDLCHDSRCPVRDSNRVPLEYESAVLPLCHPAR